MRVKKELREKRIIQDKLVVKPRKVLKSKEDCEVKGMSNNKVDEVENEVKRNNINVKKDKLLKEGKSELDVKNIIDDDVKKQKKIEKDEESKKIQNSLNHLEKISEDVSDLFKDEPWKDDILNNENSYGYL